MKAVLEEDVVRAAIGTGLFLTFETACSQKSNRFQSRTRTFKFHDGPAYPEKTQVFIFFFTFSKTMRSAARRSFVPESLLPSPIVESSSTQTPLNKCENLLLTLSCYYISTSTPTAAHFTLWTYSTVSAAQLLYRNSSITPRFQASCHSHVTRTQAQSPSAGSARITTEEQSGILRASRQASQFEKTS